MLFKSPRTSFFSFLLALFFLSTNVYSDYQESPMYFDIYDLENSLDCSYHPPACPTDCDCENVLLDATRDKNGLLVNCLWATNILDCRTQSELFESPMEEENFSEVESEYLEEIIEPQSDPYYSDPIEIFEAP